MKHITALIIKFLIALLVLLIALNYLTDLTYARIFYISIAVTIPSYIISDLLILPASSNIIATIVDIGLAGLTIYMFNYLWNFNDITISDAIISAVLIGVGELFFHNYVQRKVLPEAKDHSK